MLISLGGVKEQWTMGVPCSAESTYLPRLFLTLWASFFWGEQPFPLEDGESGPCEEVLAKFQA